ncbi:UDP-N-acetylmuramate dehydrogenase [Synechococcus sp. CC9311]|uniref:UDP-N-acetylenolpyruvoylglucosamine reductase n=1 Tax=Synechococcus sp. (strain CC9311) TaxID=64471 RepID=MURB_SYNS3|nr:UDP-N-acetylmuramate dehydrogenase [Synechococcus sp. CC9311]Q0IE56.1 RecName: Full=UDP-N-acetylenolpyruvoylglucosamine reductase; AltName: Full=UDP-N-acetylmuramate dehydrogenase [Synechococcus sp. CC9311]ABI47331.1 UDP-N-acetylenolpyruvoylglucosamine reductase [Synechococcus sp. CC9311]
MFTGDRGLNALLESGVLQQEVPLANYTTWRVGGPAQWLAEPNNAEQCLELLQWAKAEGLTTRVIGAGSNLLIADAGLPGLTLCLRRLQGSQLDAESGQVKALAGEPLPTLARRAARLGLHGLEWAVGIPGTVGGAAAMNAGAQGGSTADCLTAVEVIDQSLTDTVKTTTLLSNTDLAYDYRHSLLQGSDQMVVAAQFQLEPGHDAKELMRKTSGNLSHRTTTQPYQWPSCGSVFRNPEPEKAGQLIEGLGLKGRRIGGAEVSSVHANFIVNVGDATADDIRALIDLVQNEVERMNGITLHPEVKRLGFQTTD